MQTSLNLIKEKNYLYKLILFMFVTSIFIESPYRSVFEMLFYVVFLYYLLIHQKKITIYFLWSVSIIFFSGLSLFWSPHLTQSLVDFRIMIQAALIGNLIISYVDTEEKIKDILIIFVLSGLVLVVFVLSNNSFAEIMNSQTRIGGLEGIEINSNRLGQRLAVSSIFSLYLSKYNKSTFYFILTVIFLVFTILSGSRTALIFALLGFNGVTFLYSNNRIQLIKNFIGIILVTFIFYFVLLNVPVFYEIAGHRIESLVLSIFLGTEGDSSIQVRESMIREGFDIIKNNPLFGNGIGSYGHISGWNRYSHNNYIELLTGIGLIGTISYYSMYILILRKLYSNRLNKILVPALVFILILPLIEIGQVTYNILFWHVLISFSFAVSRIVSKDINMESMEYTKE